ncbi:hypothetical protein FHT70_005673 [Rhizobium sp. BK049]|nr:hypothetical protein [Rhizobium sp. BK049]
MEWPAGRSAPQGGSPLPSLAAAPAIVKHKYEAMT